MYCFLKYIHRTKGKESHATMSRTADSSFRRPQEYSGKRLELPVSSSSWEKQRVKGVSGHCVVSVLGAL
jgi:hypothetical protein